MKTLFATLLCFGVCAVLASAGGADKGAPKIVGTWAGVSGVADGKKLSGDEFASLKLVVTIKEDGKYSVSVMGNSVEAGTYKVDGAKKPAHIDLQITDGNDKGKTQVGLLKLEGDLLTVAFAKGGSKERPKNFDGGEGIEVTVLKRSK